MSPNGTGAAAPDAVSRVLCFAAHPDDLDFGAAGTVATWTAAGVEVQYCLMTDGDAGGFDPDHRDSIVEMRRREQQDAAALVGVDTVHFLGHRDGYLEPSHEVVEQVVALIREVRPDVVLAMHPERDWERLQRSHPDHLACGEAVTRAVYPAVENPYSYPHLAEGGLEAFKLSHLWLYAGPRSRENHWVDITGQFAAKVSALRQHLSQHPDVGRMEDYVRTQLETKGREGGLEPGRLAEAFHVVEVNGPDTIAGF
ncbi:PIG-L deacetylase family protein [Zhihengliuella salsuginis]|uniref:GlcNAc-PI de-N-acetylase n=1 Tax=Zhihengliuella salsuginis TaxID=578222 RepID=A0ABQ3GG72_9MICC|nr:PIG-L deacetylase family protein [Zhihengliuella salsuginis]GHD03602.1 GlcNAc-PI de-N-acetylase [Zhihengliuella salsuginis]